MNMRLGVTFIYRDPLYGGSLKPTPEPKTFFYLPSILPSIHAFRGVHHDAPPIKSSLVPADVPANVRPCRSAEPGPLPHTFRPALCPPRAFPTQTEQTHKSQPAVPSVIARSQQHQVSFVGRVVQLATGRGGFHSTKMKTDSSRQRRVCLQKKD